MKVMYLAVAAVVFLSGNVFAQNSDCRQSWMAPDAPAFCAWQTEPSLPEARTYHAVAFSDKYIYVLGGFRYDASTSQVTYYDSVVESTIDPSGRLSSWRGEPSFKTARSGAAAATVGNCLFVVGGSSSTSTSLAYYDDVQYARIGTDGHLSTWTMSPNHLKIPRSNHSLVAVTTDQGTFLQTVAGVTQIGTDTVHLDTIEVAKVGNDCSVSEWKPASYHVKGGRSTPQALVMQNSTVVIGGWGDLDLIDVYDDTQVASTRPDGSPSPWRIAPSRLPSGIYGHATILATSDKQPSQSIILSLGGQPGTGAYANWVSYAYILSSTPSADAIGIWRIAPTGKLPTGRAGIAAVQFRSRAYVIGGNDASGQYYRDVLSARFDIGSPR